MSEQTTANSLLVLSRQLEHLAEAAAHAVVGIRLHGRLVASGLVWKPGVVVTASDPLEADDDISVVPADRPAVSAQFAGRDPTTDVAVLPLSNNLPEPARVTMRDAARVGQIVLALGRGEEGGIANLGNGLGCRWAVAEHARWKYRQPDPPRRAAQPPLGGRPCHRQ